MTTKRPPPTAANPAPPEFIPDTNHAIAISTSPDVCQTPIGSAVVSIPYPVYGLAGDDSGYTGTVFANGLAMKIWPSKITKTIGDQPGTLKGVKSGTVGDVIEPTSHSSIVRIEGEWAIRHGDTCTLNKGNCPGEYIFLKSLATSPPPEESIQEPEPKDEDQKAEQEAITRRKQALKERIATLQSTIEDNKGSANPYDWFRDSMREESIAKAQSQLADLEIGTSRGILTQIDDATVALADSLVEGAEDLAGAVWGLTHWQLSMKKAILTNDTEEAERLLSEAGDTAQGLGESLYDTATSPSDWYQGPRDAWATGQFGAAVGEVAPDAAGVIGLGKAAAKKVAGTAARAGEKAAATKATEVAAGKKAATVANDASSGGTQKLDTQDGKSGGRITQRPSLRLKYLGRTPGKASRTGKEVIERMRKEGKVRESRQTGVAEFQASNGKWYEISQADMAHKYDAVTWWNNTGRQYGAQTTEVRRWMLDSDNYYLELNSINRSQGAILGNTERYLPPLK